MTTQTLPNPKSLWRFFPLWMIGALLLVVAVNSYMIYQAISTFPGLVDEHAYDTGNNYNAIMDSASRQAALGWQLNVNVKGRELKVSLVDAKGKAIDGLNLSAIANRPLGAPETTPLKLNVDGTADVSALGAGQWAIAINASAHGATYRTIRRVVIE